MSLSQTESQRSNLLHARNSETIYSRLVSSSTISRPSFPSFSPPLLLLLQRVFLMMGISSNLFIPLDCKESSTQCFGIWQPSCGAHAPLPHRSYRHTTGRSKSHALSFTAHPWPRLISSSESFESSAQCSTFCRLLEGVLVFGPIWIVLRRVARSTPAPTPTMRTTSTPAVTATVSMPATATVA